MAEEEQATEVVESVSDRDVLLEVLRRALAGDLEGGDEIIEIVEGMGRQDLLQEAEETQEILDELDGGESEDDDGPDVEDDEDG